MKATTSRRLLPFLKTTLFLFVLVAAVGALSAFRAAKVYDDLWQQLGISKTKGEQNIKESFLSGYFHYYGAEKAKNILTGNRAAVAKDLLAYTKQQVNSDAFRKDYEQMRRNARPQEPVITTPDKEAIRKEKITELEKSLKESKEMIVKMPDLAKTMAPTIEMFEKTLKDYKDPKSATIELLYKGELMNVEQRKQEYVEDLATWEKNWPADYRIKVRDRLTEFVQLARTVDFSAELKLVNGKKKFVNPTYEYKPSNWKQIFRAGKEVIDPAIAFAEQWLKEIK